MRPHRLDRQVVCFRRKDGYKKNDAGAGRGERLGGLPERPVPNGGNAGFPYRAGGSTPDESRMSSLIPLIGTAVVAATILPSMVAAVMAAGAAVTLLPLVAFVSMAVVWATFASLALLLPLAFFLLPSIKFLFPAAVFLPGLLLDKVAALLALIHFGSSAFGARGRLVVERDLDEDALAENILAAPPLSSPSPEDRWAPLALLAWVPLVGPAAAWLLASARTPELSDERRDRYIKSAVVYSFPLILAIFNLSPGAGLTSLGVSGLFSGSAWWVCLVLGGIHVGIETAQLRGAVQRVRRDIVDEAVPQAGSGAAFDAVMQRELDDFDARLGRVPALEGPPQGWSVSDVTAWLVRNGWGRYAAEFASHRVDGRVLLALDSGEMRDELGVASLGDRKKLMADVEALRGRVGS